MTRSTYIQAVFSHLKRLTRRERESIRAELDGHMEDHFEACGSWATTSGRRRSGPSPPWGTRRRWAGS